jgi:preprotein translocase subunit SecG
MPTPYPDDDSPTPPPDFREFAATCGLHPFAGFGLFALDQMLAGLEIVSFFTLLIASILVSLALIPCVILLQRSYGDGWGAATGKGVLAGLITACPGSFMSVFTAGWAVMGVIGMRHRTNNSKTIDTTSFEGK